MNASSGAKFAKVFPFVFQLAPTAKFVIVITLKEGLKRTKIVIRTAWHSPNATHTAHQMVTDIFTICYEAKRSENEWMQPMEVARVMWHAPQALKGAQRAHDFRVNT